MLTDNRISLLLDGVGLDIYGDDHEKLELYLYPKSGVKSFIGWDFNSEVRLCYSSGNLLALGFPGSYSKVGDLSGHGVYEVSLCIFGRAILKVSLRILSLLYPLYISVSLRGDSGNLWSLFSSLSLSDLDFSLYDHEFTSGNISASLRDTGVYGEISDDLLLYPLVDYGGMSVSGEVNVSDRRPFINVRRLFYGIYSAQGWDVVSDFISSDYFGSLYMSLGDFAMDSLSLLSPFSAHVSGDQLLSSRELSSGLVYESLDVGSYSVHTVWSSTDESHIGSNVDYVGLISSGDYLEAVQSDGSVSYLRVLSVSSSLLKVFGYFYSDISNPLVCLGRGLVRHSWEVVSLSNTIKFSSLCSDFSTNRSSYRISYSSNYVFTGSVSLLLSSVGSAVRYVSDQVHICLVSNIRGLVYEKSYIFDNEVYSFNTGSLWFNKGEFLHIEVRLALNVDRSSYTGSEVFSLYCMSSGSRWGLSGQSIDLEGFVRVNSLLPGDVRQSDFLSSIAHMFNLYYCEDYISRCVYIEPRDSFYMSESVDWSNKLVKGSSIELHYPGSRYEGRVQYLYKKDVQDGYLEGYSGGLNWDSHIIENPNSQAESGISLFRNTVFSPTLLGSSAQIGLDRTRIPKMNISYYSYPLMSDQHFDFNYRILRYSGLRYTSGRSMYFGDLDSIEGWDIDSYPVLYCSCVMLYGRSRIYFYGSFSDRLSGVGVLGELVLGSDLGVYEFRSGYILGGYVEVHDFPLVGSDFSIPEFGSLESYYFSGLEEFSYPKMESLSWSELLDSYYSGEHSSWFSGLSIRLELSLDLSDIQEFLSGGISAWVRRPIYLDMKVLDLGLLSGFWLIERLRYPLGKGGLVEADLISLHGRMSFRGSDGISLLGDVDFSLLSDFEGVVFSL